MSSSLVWGFTNFKNGLYGLGLQTDKRKILTGINEKGLLRWGGQID